VYAKNDPPEEDLFHAASLSPEVAVMEAFRWANDPTEVSRIVDTYNSYLRTGHATLSDSSPQSSASQSSDAPRKQIGKNDVMEFHFLAWKSIAEKYNFVAPDSDAVLSAFVIDDPYIVAGRGFGWTTDHELLEKIVSDFHEMVETQIREATGAPQLSAHPSPVPDLPTQVTAPFISIRDKALEATVMAWNQVAQSYHFNPPTHEMIVAASQMSPEDAIVRLFQWSVDPTTINKVLESYAEAIRKTSAQYGVPLQVARATAPEGLATSGPTPDDVFKTEYTAWHRVATKEGKSLPNEDLVLFAMSVEPEAAVLKGFAWTTDSAEAARLAESYLKEIDVLRAQWSSSSASTPANTESAVEIPMVSAAPGAAKWVKSLLDVEMSCAVVSFLESDQVDALLRYAGLEDLFPNDRRVSSTSGYKDEVQQLLGGALRVERRPDHCVIFDSSPHASRAALENDMRNVNLVGAFPKYELLSADSVTSSFDELTAMNIRRLFGERVFDQPQTELQQPLLTKDRKTSTRTRFQDDD
jgi:beta-phosphoglucomutase-like phosphatase (HAD superfamily)